MTVCGLAPVFVQTTVVPAATERLAGVKALSTIVAKTLPAGGGAEVGVAVGTAVGVTVGVEVGVAPAVGVAVGETVAVVPPPPPDSTTAVPFMPGWMVQ